MADNTTKTGGSDRERINIHQDHEVAYWTKALGVTKAELEAAVKAVGSSAAAVREHLRK
jgi:hypothetical protein